MTCQYYCRIRGLDDDEWAGYQAKDHIEAASEYAKDVSRQVTEHDPNSYVKDITVEVYSVKSEEFWRIDIDMIHIRRM